MNLVKLPTPKRLKCLYDNDELYYVQDDITGLVILDNVSSETANIYASKHENCSAYKKN